MLQYNKTVFCARHSRHSSYSSVRSHSTIGIAETHGSSIDQLKLRYCHTDQDYKRLQNELKIQLMGPPPCTDSAEKLVEKVARRMTQKHAFLSSHERIGSAITSFKSKEYPSTIFILAT